MSPIPNVWGFFSCSALKALSRLQLLHHGLTAQAGWENHQKKKGMSLQQHLSTAVP